MPRGLQPGNILLDRSGSRAKISDVGESWIRQNLLTLGWALRVRQSAKLAFSIFTGLGFFHYQSSVAQHIKLSVALRSLSTLVPKIITLCVYVCVCALARVVFLQSGGQRDGREDIPERGEKTKRSSQRGNEVLELNLRLWPGGMQGSLALNRTRPSCLVQWYAPRAHLWKELINPFISCY